MQDVNPGSITLAIKRAQTGDSDEFSKIVELHQKDVERLARHFLGGEKQSNLMLGEDIMQSVFLQLWQGLSDGKTWFVDAVTDREQLFSVLERLTWLRARKAIRHAHQKMRSGTVRDSDVNSCTDNDMSATFRDPSATDPDLNFEIKSLIEEAQSKLRTADSQLVQVFSDLLQGVSLAETADRLSISQRGVQRKRQRVRSVLATWIDKECKNFGETHDSGDN